MLLSEGDLAAVCWTDGHTLGAIKLWWAPARTMKSSLAVELFQLTSYQTGQSCRSALEQSVEMRGSLLEPASFLALLSASRLL